MKRDGNNKIILLEAKVTDDIQLAGSITALTDFLKGITRRYKVRKVIIDDDIQFNGCEISQNYKGDTRMNMSNFRRKLAPIPMEKMRRKQEKTAATKTEIEMFRSLAGALLWLGSAIMP